MCAGQDTLWSKPNSTLKDSLLWCLPALWEAVARSSLSTEESPAGWGLGSDLAEGLLCLYTTGELSVLRTPQLPQPAVPAADGTGAPPGTRSL